MPTDNERIAQHAYAALSRGDLDGFLEHVDPEVEFSSLIAEAEGRAYHGHDGVRQWWSSVADFLGGLRFELVGYHDLAEDRGYAELVVVGTVSEVEVPQRMWQAIRIRGERAIWWRTCRSEEEARSALADGQ